MENQKKVIYDENQLLDHFFKKTISSIFEIPSQGPNSYDSNKVTLENELEKYRTIKITSQDKVELLNELNKIVLRIQDFSIAGMFLCNTSYLCDK